MAVHIWLQYRYASSGAYFGLGAGKKERGKGGTPYNNLKRSSGVHAKTTLGSLILELYKGQQNSYRIEVLTYFWLVYFLPSKN